MASSRPACSLATLIVVVANCFEAALAIGIERLVVAEVGLFRQSTVISPSL